MEQKGNSSTRAKNKYNAANYDSFVVRTDKGELDRINTAAELAGLSRNAFVMEAIKEKIAREASGRPVK